ncbi:MAG: hypothetical protein AAGB13_20455 [Cyanobacteria bacterium P01_F01_bin.33]
MVLAGTLLVLGWLLASAIGTWAYFAGLSNPAARQSFQALQRGQSRRTAPRLRAL